MEERKYKNSEELVKRFEAVTDMLHDSAKSLTWAVKNDDPEYEQELVDDIKRRFERLTELAGQILAH